MSTECLDSRRYPGVGDEIAVRDASDRREKPGLAVVQMTPEIAAGSCCLPGKFHGDPADRIIAATVRSIFATIVTRDRRILNYAKQGHMTAMAL